jgi:hypothetical protein
MSFKCDQCKLQVLPRVAQKQVVREWRLTPTGKQIAKAIKVCPSCAEMHRTMGGKVI